MGCGTARIRAEWRVYEQKLENNNSDIGNRAHFLVGEPDMKPILMLVGALVLTGCVSQASLIAQDGHRYKLEIDSVMERLRADIDGVEYKGTYVQDSGLGVGQSFGARGGMSSSYMAMSGSTGQAVMTSSSGSYIECSFNANGMTVIGKCQSNTGRQFVLTTE